MAPSNDVQRRRRIELVNEHVRQENAHNVAGILATFGSQPSYHDEPWQDHREGADGVRQYYEELVAAIPDLVIEIANRHVAEETIVLEVTISGSHFGAWRGLPATGRPLRFSLCAVYTFDAHDQLASERIYYDRAGLLHQLGVFHEPNTLAGRLITAVTHPLTIARSYCRILLGKRQA